MNRKQRVALSIDKYAVREAAEESAMSIELLRKFTVLSVAACFALLALATALPAWSDDTELYSATYSSGANGRPKVLIIFDDSGSMDEIVYGERPPFTPTPDVAYQTAVPSDRIYWSTDGSPPSLTGWNNESDQWFPTNKNRCGDSYDTLDTSGLYSGTAAQWQESDGAWVTETNRVCTRWRWGWCRRWRNVTTTYWDGDEAGWVELEGGENAPVHVECSTDESQNPPLADNGDYLVDGFPQAAGAVDTPTSDAYDVNVGNSVYWPEAYTFYTSQYMDWYYDETIVPEDKDYLQIAQETVESIIDNNQQIDFGLEVFNYNYDYYNYNKHSGGRIVQPIIADMDDDDRADMISVLWGLDHSGNTPLCESTYEAYRYLTGQTVKYGDDRNSSYDSPDRDTSAEDPVGTYSSPLADCSNTYIILMTDGLPTRDGDADDEVEDLTGEDCWEDPDDSSNESCLPTITQFMAEEDLDGQFSNGTQNVLTATIGFNVSSESDNLMEATATLTKEDGSPAYYYAESADDLNTSFQQILLGILESETNFTAPAVAVNSFTRTESLDDVFFAMFEPQTRADWFGNIKKLKFDVTTVNGEEVAVLKDADNADAIGANGQIANSARTYWSAVADGESVTAGGVGGRLVERVLSTRKLYAATGDNNALELLNTTNMTADVFGLNPGDADFYNIWQVDDQADLAETLVWAWGYDVDDNDGDLDVTDTRDWIMPDVLHSKPLVVNYGALGSFTIANPDLRILAGSNGGFLHMFSNDTGDENWAYFPLDLAPVLAQRRKNTTNGENVYGVDSPAVVYKVDHNGDGTIDAAGDNDEAYVYFGLRRGGSSMHALNISDPDNPAFMWAINNGDLDFEEMGQTWSIPKVTTIPGYSDDTGAAKPVVVFGAGYDINKDTHEVLVTPDSEGRGVFIVDAMTGALVWSVTPADNSATNMQELGLLHSVAAQVSLLDSNGDQRTDRIYFADTGGNLWRIDLSGNVLPSTQQDEWFIVKVFESNALTAATDRRFFSAVDVVRTVHAGINYDALVIGSGDRTNPIDMIDPLIAGDTAVDNQFYMIRDEKTVPYVVPLDTSECTNDPDHDFRCQLPLDPSDLYDAGEDLITVGTDEEKEDAYEALVDEGTKGWLLNLEANGEKSLSASVTISGTTYFTTFSPDVDEALECGFTTGQARLYAVDLFSAAAVRDFDDDGDYERFATIGSLIPDTIATHTDEYGVIRGLVPPAKGGGDLGNPFDLKAVFPDPSGTYWHQEEY